MNTIRYTTAIMALAAALALPAIAHADEAAPAAASAETPDMPAPGMGRGMGPGMGMGPMAAERCQMRRAGMMSMNRPCRTMDRDETDKRIEMLEKRLDAMQLTLELLVRQQASGVAQ